MTTKPIIKEENNVIEQKSEPFLKYVFETAPSSGKKTLTSFVLSDGTTKDDPLFYKKVLAALKRATGSNDSTVAGTIVEFLSWGMTDDDNERRIAKVLTLLPQLKPQDEAEALLLGQFLALQDSGIACVHNANYNEIFYHKKELFQLSVKLFRCANETMQTLLKYRSGGKQQIQVIHVEDGGKAVIANEMNTTPGV